MGNGFRSNKTLHLTGGVEARIGDRQIYREVFIHEISDGVADRLAVSSDVSSV
jgi:hypothetical protein